MISETIKRTFRDGAYEFFENKEREEEEVDVEQPIFFMN